MQRHSPDQDLLIATHQSELAKVENKPSYKGYSCKLGNCSVYRYKSLEVVVGPDYQGIVASFTIFSLLFILGARCIIVSSSMNSHWKTMHITAITYLAICCSYYYSLCAFSDPGFLLSNYEFPAEAKLGYFCFDCGFQKSREYSHCHECGRCILQRENHCGWIGKCIGAKTSSHFCCLKRYGAAALIFVIYLFTMCQ